MKRRRITRVIAALLAVLLALGMLFVFIMPALYAADAEESTALYQVSDTAAVTTAASSSIKELPLLVLIVSFDADGDGENDYDGTNKLYKEQSDPCYGEQWAGSLPSQHYDSFFGEGNSVKSYFKEQSLGKLIYTPAEFEKAQSGEGCAEDGILSVTVEGMHPTAALLKYGETSRYYTYSYGLFSKAIEKATEFVDFSAYDKNKNRKVDESELAIVLLVSGADRSTNYATYEYTASPKFHFQHHACATSASAFTDGVTLSADKYLNIAVIGEYFKPGTVIGTGVLTHELAHCLGAHDLYNTAPGETGGDENVDATWPMPYRFSLQCTGSQINSSNSPSYLDPYQRLSLGFYDSLTEIKADSPEGTYTLYSTLSGKYNVLKICTVDPNEYFLCEIRNKEGAEKNLTGGDSTGGVMVWHIDESINKMYLSSGYACTGAEISGKVHDPGIVPLFREGFNTDGNRMSITNPDDPFYHLTGDESTFVFDSENFSSAVNRTVSLNSYPYGWDMSKVYNVHIEVLCATGEKMDLKVSFEKNQAAPKVSASLAERAKTSLTLSGDIYELYGNTITERGFIFSKLNDPDEENGSVFVCKDGFSYTVSGLDPNTKYNFKAYVKTPYGTFYSNATSAVTVAERSFYYIYLYRNLAESDKRPREVKLKPGDLLSYSFPMEKKGYAFGGWYYDTDFKNAFDMTSTRTDTDADITLYARWIAEKDAVTPVYTGAEVTDAFSVKKGECIKEPNIKPESIEGKGTFTGWFTDEACIDKYDFTQKTKESGEIKLYAGFSGGTQAETTAPPEKETTASQSGNETTAPGETTAETDKKAGMTSYLIIIITALLVFSLSYFFIRRAGIKAEERKRNNLS